MLSRLDIERASTADLVDCATDAADSGTLLSELAAWLTEHGYARGGFAQALADREAAFPTGLAGAGGGVAVPHAQPELILRPAVMLCRPAAPVAFHRMDAPEREVAAELVLLLAIPDAKAHLELLRSLSAIFSDAALFRRLLLGGRLSELLELESDPKGD
jgi:PTS system galactitol-specific IIA component